jgi:hypothetical protein
VAEIFRCGTIQIVASREKGVILGIHHNPRNSISPSNFETSRFIGLSFSTGAGENREDYRVCVQLNALDEDLLIGVFVNAKSRAIVRRAAILGFLPSGLNDEWPYTGYIFSESAKSDWDMAVPPTVLRGHNVWIIEDTICDQ